jgi:hypothetical protein
MCPGWVSTLAGQNQSYADGVGRAANFYGPFGLGLDSNGQLFVSEINNHRIRSISSSGLSSCLAVFSLYVAA